MTQIVRKYSDYYYELDSNVKIRYQEKLSNIDDPYTSDSDSFLDNMLEIEYPDINIFINTLTKEELKAYKSL